MPESYGLKNLGVENSFAKSAKTDVVAVVVVRKSRGFRFQNGGAARVFLWPSIQAAVSADSEDFLRSLCWLNDAIAFSERGPEGPWGRLGVWGWVVASSSHCNPPISRRVLSSGFNDNAAGRWDSAFRVVVD
jgi:hypothetical protein